MNTPASSSSSPQVNERTKLALIAEGGGQRGIFTAGVLDAWLAENYDPFDMFIGTSAGSQNLTSFLARQKGYAKRLIRGLSRHKRFFQVGRGLVGKHIVDLDWYFDKTKETNRLLDFSAATENLGDRELLITATNSRNRKPYFLSPTGSANQWRELLKASSALPFLYKQGVELTTDYNASSYRIATKNAESFDVPSYSNASMGEGARKDTTKKAINGEYDATCIEQAAPTSDFYLDGGLAAPLPVREAYERGARKIVVIRTGDINFQARSAWLHKLKSLVCATGHCPKTINYLVQHEQAYQQELAFIANPPADVEIIQIFAGKPLHSKLLGSTDSDLRHDYKVGVSAGKHFLAQHEEARDYNIALPATGDLAPLAKVNGSPITSTALNSHRLSA